MIFSAATFLYLLPLVGLPIVFHLILKQKRRRVVFSTLMFFYRVDPRLNSRRQIRHWLLLLMRVLLILLLLLALSRPSIRLTGNVGGKLSVVALVDNSGSMSGVSEDEGLTKLERATEAARRLFTSLPDQAEAALVTLVDDPAVTVPDALTTDRAALLESLDTIRVTEATGDAPGALSRAFQLLQASAAGGGVVHVFTDLQEVEWGKGANRLDVKQERINVVFHRINTPPRRRANVAITGIQYPGRRPLLGQPYDIGLVLRNDSDVPAEIRVHSLDAHDQRNTEPVTMSAHQVHTVRVPVTISEPGHHWVRTWIEGDDFAADNAAGVGLSCDGLATVYLVGQPAEYGVLPMALSPTSKGRLTGLITQFGPIPTGRSDPNETGPVLMVTTWDRLEADASDAMSLRSFVEAGGNLLVVPSERRTGHGANRRTPSWLGASTRSREAYTRGVRLRPAGRNTRFWREISRTDTKATSVQIAAYAFQPLELSQAFTSLLTAGADKVVLAQRSLGQGNIFVSGTAFSPRWNTLPLSGVGVVMTHYMAAAGGVSLNTDALVVVAGQPPRPPASVTGEIEIVSLIGDVLEWNGRSNRLPVLAKAGVYLINSEDQKYPVSVRASEAEGVHTFVEGTVVSAMGPVAHTVTTLEREFRAAQFHRHQARALDLFLPLLLLATLALFIEGILGAPRTLRTRQGQAISGTSPSTSWVGRFGLGSLVTVVSRVRVGRTTERDSSVEPAIEGSETG